MKQCSVQGRSGGSALILTVVLTSLLAIVGVLFLMAARIDKMSTSATVENQELNYAVDSILTRIRAELAEDVPLDPRKQEYYDFPDANDLWLADIEPYEREPNVYRWRQISDVTGYLKRRGFRTQDVAVDPCGPSKVVTDYPDIQVAGPPGEKQELVDHQMADADGDGIADSKWIEFDDLKLSRGKPVYAAIRIVDNGAMLNANTGYRFDPDANDAWVDGRSQLQVNVLGLAVRAGLQPTRSDEAELFRAWADGTRAASASELQWYEREVIWQYGDPVPAPGSGRIWTPFDLSDELELRYRYCINSKTHTRMEAIWNTVGSDGSLELVSEPYDSYYKNSGPNPKAKGRRLDDWIERVTNHPAAVEPDRRHLVTTYSMDRILAPRVVQFPDGSQSRKMINVNRIDNENLLYVLRDTIADAIAEVYGNTATQIAVNLKDYVDADDEITVMAGTTTSNWYGFEQPCIYISELACRRYRNPSTGLVYESYAIELHKPYFEDKDPKRGEWYLAVDNPSGRIEQEIAWSGTRRFHVLMLEDPDPNASLKKDYLRFSEPDPIDALSRFRYDPSGYLKREQIWRGLRFTEGVKISLLRKIPSGPPEGIEVDSMQVPAGWILEDGVARSIQRDISPYRCIWRLWASAAEVSTPGLGNDNGAGRYVSPQQRPVLQAHPANRPLTNIGELGMVFARTPYFVHDTATPSELLVDLAHPMYSRLFNYLTVIDPWEYGHPDSETRIKGRININTAPWFVLAQLPWMQYDPVSQGNRSFDRARAVVTYRNRKGAYRSIGELMQITSRTFDPNAASDYPLLGLPPDPPGGDFQHRHSDNPRGPDLTYDTAQDDFEERDLIFTRISNLVTVRSDVFTAYILVRIGTDGPQKRVIAILDRSQVNGPGDQVRVVARHLVPDPR